ncbi:hypothetical protein HW132_34420 [Brasilonema sp. CT11]|nr:hypothetical protein [Brasilonema sp. CT11]
MKFAWPNMSFKPILQKIKPMRDKMGVATIVKRQNFLEEVFKYDAHNVLKHVIDVRRLILGVEWT